MCDVRDTLILPCRHLCLCNSCADSLRYQANNCPICRAPFRALLQIRALQKCANANLSAISSADVRCLKSFGFSYSLPCAFQIGCDNIPPGYEAISLIEALNGPCSPRQPPSAMPDLVETPENEHSIQAAQILNRQCDRSTPTKNRSKCELSSPDYEVTTMMEHKQQEDERESQKLLSGDKCGSRIKHRQKDSVKLVNEKLEMNEVSNCYYSENINSVKNCTNK